MNWDREEAEIKTAAERFVRWRVDRKQRPPQRRKRPIAADAAGFVESGWDDLELA